MSMLVATDQSVESFVGFGTRNQLIAKAARSPIKIGCRVPTPPSAAMTPVIAGNTEPPA